MKNKGCLIVIVIFAVLGIIGKFSGTETAYAEKVSYKCVWCKEMFVGDEGELSCYYYDEKYRGCGYHTVTKNTLTGFCTSSHCDLYAAANR